MKSGFVAIIGRPNVGKSSLLNKILNFKVSITSATPQTTRNQVKGIYNDKESQIIFLDTPGIHKPKQKLGESLNQASYKSLVDADLILFLQPIDQEIGPGDQLIIEKINKYKNKIAVLTKIDKSNQENAKQKAEKLKQFGFKYVVGTSIKIQNSIDHFVDFIKEKLPESELYFENDQITDVSVKFIAKEMIREAVIESTSEEVPHSIGVLIDEFNEIKEGQKHGSIYATIFVERDSQKGIIIGKNGKKIKKIGTISRKNIEKMLGHKIFLKLRVKVVKN